jgi:peptidoglycan/LPS O-acetylase OafA/YrhL
MENFYSGHQIKALTGLRGVGALLVVVYHFHLNNMNAMGLFFPFFRYGGAVGIMIFFALSGYLLSHIYHTNFRSFEFSKDYLDFIWKRIARIYPLHIFLLFLTLFFYPGLNIGGYSGPRQLFTNLTLTHGWTFDDLSFIAASWSISVEFLFYLIFPIMVLVVNRWVAIIIFLALGIFYALVKIGMAPISPELEPYFGHKIFEYGAFFVLGVSVFFMARHSLIRQLLDNNYTFVALLMILIILPYTSQLAVALGASAFIIPLWIRSVHTSKIGNYLLSGSVMLLLGELSYSIYMSHQMIFQLLTHIDQRQPVIPLIGWGAYYVLLFIWCIFCYNLIEVPMRSRLRNMLRQ